MTNLAVLIPDAVTNYITNPSMRFDTTGWNAQGATITRSLEQSRFGIASLKVVTNGSVLREGTFFRVSVLSGISENITVSVYVRGTGRVRIRLDNNVVGGTEYASQPVKLSATRWQRIYITGFSTGGNDMRLYVETDDAVVAARTFYVDGAQMERKAHLTTYCDGDQPGCRWAGTQHASLSDRYAYTREGGRWFELAGKERQEQDLYMTVAGGLGMPPTTIDRHSFSVAPGGFVTGRKIQPRLITFTFHAKRQQEQRVEQAISLAHLHEMRQILIELVNADDARGEEIWFLYDDGFPLYFRGRYDGGLEGEWDVRNPFVNSFPLRILALDPFMVEDDQQSQVLDFQNSSVNEFNDIVGRIDGEWDSLNYGVDNAVGDIEPGRKGEIYISGSFETVNLNASAVDPNLTAKYVAYYDGTQWRALSQNTVGAIINDVAVAPNGDIYVTGQFTTIGGVAATNIAKFNGSVWSALGTGLNNDGLHISIDARGNVYVGGNFSTAGGVTAQGIAKWDGFQWRGVGQFSGLNDSVNSIAISPDGATVYVGGLFTDQRGFALSRLLRIAVYDVATDRFSAVGAGFNDNVNEVVIGPDNILYACGVFSLSGTTTINRIGKYQGGAWLPLGSGMDGIVHSFDVGLNGDIIAVGEFDRAGGLEARNVALWNGSTWAHLDIDIAVGHTNVDGLAVQYLHNGDVIIGGGDFDVRTTLFSAINTVENIGSAESAPVVYILGPGRMRWLENQTTKQRVFFDLTVLNGEEIFIDFDAGQIFSTQRGNLFHSILPGSDFNAFTLAPGENRIACFMTNDVGAQIQISYQPTHWSADAVPIAL